MSDRKCWSIVKTHCDKGKDERSIEIVASVPTRYHPHNSVGGPTRGRFYSLKTTQTLCDLETKKQGNMWYLPEKVHSVIFGTFTAYMSGFTFASRDRGTYFEERFYPHTFIRPCALQMRADTIKDPFCFIFLIGSQNVPDPKGDTCRSKSYYFAVSGTNSDDVLADRTLWLDLLSHNLHQVTLSMFPRESSISTWSGSDIHTEDLVMAGYLLLQLDNSTLRTIYAVLHPQHHEVIRLELYDNEKCIKPFFRQLSISPKTSCYEKMGYSSCCFVIDGVHFVARTTFERRVWMRAICNLKVKVQSRAPFPGASELAEWRKSINDHMTNISDKSGVNPVFEMTSSAFPLCSPPHISPLHGDCPCIDDIDDDVSDGNVCSDPLQNVPNGTVARPPEDKATPST
eukprot:GEMP01033783.1.p1 GENE.GEMP01033783.1~~GEMP01033783.1.p1  ORF type:complete len:399 (+),score=53.82 GEMP01033783.1:72-1268(+)